MWEVRFRTPRILGSRRLGVGHATRPGEVGVTKPAPLLPPPPFRRPRPRALSALRRPLAGSARQSRGRAPAAWSPAPSPGPLLHHHSLRQRRSPGPSGQHRLPDSRSPGSAAAGLQSAASWSQPQSARRPASPRLRSDSQGFAGPSRRALCAPPFVSLCFGLSSSPTLRRAVSTHAPTARCAAASKGTGSVLPALRRGRPRRLATDRGKLASGVSAGRTGPASPRGPLAAAPPLRPLCARRNPLGRAFL